MSAGPRVGVRVESGRRCVCSRVARAKLTKFLSTVKFCLDVSPALAANVLRVGVSAPSLSVPPPATDEAWAESAR
jgi:hypothetical protein